MVQALVNEQERLVKNSIAQFIGIVGKYEFPDNTWPEIMQFIHQLCNSENVLDREVIDINRMTHIVPNIEQLTNYIFVDVYSKFLVSLLFIYSTDLTNINDISKYVILF